MIIIFQFNLGDTAPGKRAITPLYLGSICKEWRHLVWSTPLLWRDIAMHVIATDSQVALLRDWLLRAGTTPLDITLKESFGGSYKDLVFLQRRVLSTLVTHSAYWSSFSCASLMFECYDVFRDVHFPILKTIYLRAYLSSKFITIFPLYDHPPPSAMFVRSPQLTSLLMDRYPFDEAITLSNQITTFGICKIGARDLLTILQSLKRLESAQFPNVEHDDLPSPHPIHIVSNHTLSSLRIGINNEEVPRRSVLDHIKLPSLVDLRIQPPYSRLSSITSFITRSGCSLKSLDIKIMLSEEDDLVATFEAVPTLVKLNLCFETSTDFKHMKPEVINALNPTYRTLSGRQPLLPNLTSFGYLDHISEDCQLPFAQLVQRRWSLPEANTGNTSPAVARLQSIKFVSKECAPELRELLLELSSQGMQVEFEEALRPKPS
ncbi:hypothetical protein CPC08DRAFT_499276 [Agrocybe pediades]|nr:hypothetical protein CPC08DRAFT_499276 [Agrocybe pediades]